MEIETKQKVKKGLLIGYVSLTTIFTIFMIIMLAIAGVQNKKQVNKKQAYNDYQVQEVVNSKVQPKYVSYNDAEYQITLSTNEANTYTWSNLYNFINNEVQNNSIGIDEILLHITYYDVTYDYNDDSNGAWSFIDLNNPSDEKMYFIYNISLWWDSVYEGTDELNNYIFHYTLDDESFSDSLTLTIVNTYYSNFKSAIELDIQANESNINDGVFETLTDSVVAFIGSISSGITAMVSVFWSNDSLTVIGTLSVIVVAVSLAYFLFRLIIGLIRMRG